MGAARRTVSAQTNDAALRRVKAIHTVAWVFFAGCTCAIFVAAWFGRLRLASLFIAIVTVEVLILAFNQWHCPLTPVAARYTKDRKPNFDIYLPLWLATYNKEIFGAMYVSGIVFTLARWIMER